MTTAPAAPAWNRALGAGLLASALCLLALELVLSRIFSVLMWYHFVSLVISLALFGITASGLLVFLLPRRFPAAEAPRWMGRASLALALATLALWCFFFLLARTPQLAYRILAPFHQPQYEPFGSVMAQGLLERGQLLPLAVLYLVSALPFFFGGFVATLALARYRGEAARVYAWDLAGAGLGCLGAFALLTAVDPFTALAVLAALAAAGAAVFFREAGARAWRTGALLLALAAAGLAAATAAAGLVEIKFVRGRYQPDILRTRWNSYSRVAVWPLRGGQAEASWGMSRRYRGALPEQLGLVVDDTGYSTIVRHRPGDDLAWARANLLALPHLLRRDPRVLIIGPGGGKDILVARAMGEGPIRAVEINPLVVRAAEEDFADFSGRPYSLPGVEAVVDEGRTFLRRDRASYDIIQATVVYGRLAPSAGAFTFTEDHLYTREAFGDYLARLAPEGMLSFSRFIHEKRILRLVATARAALETGGATAAWAHVFIAAERGLANVIVKRDPFTVGEVALLEARCRELGFEVLHSPAREGSGPLARLLRAARAEEYLAALPFDASPVDDDRPFFYYLLRPADFLRGAAPAPDFDDRGLLLLRNLLVTVLLLVALCIFLPLALRGGDGPIRRARSLAAVAYFAAIGLGFIVVEIGLLKRFLLLLGKPVYTLAVTLAVFLAAGAAGSARAAGLAGRPGLLRRRCAALAIVLMLASLLLPALLEGMLAAPLWARLAATVAVMAPLGYLMGQPLPAGLALIRDERLVPWVWSVNGALSVLGSVAALALAVNVGYTTTMLVGPACYLVAGALAEVLE